MSYAEVVSDLSTALICWFDEYARDLPWRAPDFSAWGTLVSETMLQQTQVSRVCNEIQIWLERWPTPQSLAQAETSEVIRAWGNLGYPRRAIRLQQAAQQILTRFDGEVPNNVSDLLSLPGVGDYTARAVAVFHFKQRHPVVDTNVRRVYSRAIAGQSDQGSPSKKDLEEVAKLLPEDPQLASAMSAALMELGALVCLASKPLCDSCPVATFCTWRQAGYPRTKVQRRAKQQPFKGSHRQVRGKIMAALRSSDVALPYDDLRKLWEEKEQLDKALSSLLSDGLAIKSSGGYTLPQSV